MIKGDLYCCLHTVWKNEKFTLTQKFFRQINYLVILLVKSLFSRNFCEKRVRVNFRNFHTVHTVEFTKFLYHLKITEIYSHSFLAKFRESNDFTNKITK